MTSGTHHTWQTWPTHGFGVWEGLNLAWAATVTITATVTATGPQGLPKLSLNLAWAATVTATDTVTATGPQGRPTLSLDLAWAATVTATDTVTGSQKGTALKIPRCYCLCQCFQEGRPNGLPILRCLPVLPRRAPQRAPNLKVLASVSKKGSHKGSPRLPQRAPNLKVFASVSKKGSQKGSNS